MALIKYRMVASRDRALWRGQEVPAGTCKLILAAESAEDVTWFFSKIDWSAWRLEPVDESLPAGSKTSGRPKIPQPA